MLIIRHNGITACSDFLDNGRFVATYDGGPCSLWFANGKEFSFSLWSEGEVKDRIFPKGAAKIACVIDCDYQIVPDNESASRIVYGNGETTYYREGERKIVAHSETPFGNKNKWKILCNGNTYDVIYNKNFLYSLAKIYEKDNLVGSIFTIAFIFGMTWTRFLKDLYLSERVFITHLSNYWWQDQN